MYSYETTTKIFCLAKCKMISLLLFVWGIFNLCIFLYACLWKKIQDVINLRVHPKRILVVREKGRFGFHCIALCGIRMFLSVCIYYLKT